MLKEEFRTHTSYSGKSRFMSFPVFVFFLSLGSGLTINKMLETVSLTQFALFAHASAFMYGISVGAFGLMGRISGETLRKEQLPRRDAVSVASVLQDHLSRYLP